MKHAPIIIGIAGSFASGKDTLAHHLVEKYGFMHFSTGDMIRLEAQEQRGSVERPVLYEVADAMRHRYGADYFVQRALREGAQATGIVVTGMRSLGEARAIKRAGGQLLFVDAPAQIRYERMKERHRDQETLLSLDEFVANESHEWHSGDGEADFNLTGIKAMADARLENIIGRDEFLAAADNLLGLAE